MVPVDYPYDEVSARGRVPVLDAQQFGGVTENFGFTHADPDFGGEQPRMISLFKLVVDFALVLKRRYFT